MKSTAIAVESRSRIPSRFKGRIWKPFAAYEAFYEQDWRLEQRANLAGVTLPLNKRVFVSAILHVGNQSKEEGPSTTCCSA